jgi:hypothetical protein
VLEVVVQVSMLTAVQTLEAQELLTKVLLEEQAVQVLLVAEVTSLIRLVVVEVVQEALGLLEQLLQQDLMEFPVELEFLHL